MQNTLGTTINFPQIKYQIKGIVLFNFFKVIYISTRNTLLCMIDFLIDIDTKLFLLLNDLHLPFFNFFMAAFSGKVIWVPMYAAILYILYRQYGWKMATCYTLAIILAIVATDQVCAQYIRPLVERLRPAHPDNPISEEVHIVNGYRGGRYGFPSCHAANSFALATFSCLLIASKRFAIFIFAWALLNSYSRIYLGVHYPGDLLFGAIIGSSISITLYFITKKITAKINNGQKITNEKIKIGGRTYLFKPSDAMIAVGCLLTTGIFVYSYAAL